MIGITNAVVTMNEFGFTPAEVQLIGEIVAHQLRGCEHGHDTERAELCRSILVKLNVPKEPGE